MLPGLLSAIKGFLRNIIADIDEYLCGLLQKAIKSRSSKELDNEVHKLKSDLIKMSNNPVFRKNKKDINIFINKVEKTSNKAIKFDNKMATK